MSTSMDQRSSAASANHVTKKIFRRTSNFLSLSRSNPRIHTPAKLSKGSTIFVVDGFGVTATTISSYQQDVVDDDGYISCDRWRTIDPVARFRDTERRAPIYHLGPSCRRFVSVEWEWRMNLPWECLSLDTLQSIVHCLDLSRWQRWKLRHAFRARQVEWWNFLSFRSFAELLSLSMKMTNDGNVSNGWSGRTTWATIRNISSIRPYLIPQLYHLVSCRYCTTVRNSYMTYWFFIIVCVFDQLTRIELEA